MQEEEKPIEQDVEKTATEEKPASYSKVIVAVCIMTIVLFTAVCMLYLWFGKPLNDTLIALFFGCFGIEFGSLAFIKGRKLRWVEGNPANKKSGHAELVEDEDDGKDKKESSETGAGSGGKY